MEWVLPECCEPISEEAKEALMVDQWAVHQWSRILTRLRIRRAKTSGFLFQGAIHWRRLFEELWARQHIALLKEFLARQQVASTEVWTLMEDQLRGKEKVWKEPQDNLSWAAMAYTLALDIAAAFPAGRFPSRNAKAYGDEGVIPTTPDLCLLPPRPDSTLIFAGFPPLRN